MKRYFIIAIAVGIIVTLAVIVSSFNSEIKRLTSNIESLTLDSNTHIVVTTAELKKLQLYKRELDSLKISPRKVKRINVTTVTVVTDTIETVKTKEVVKYQDKDYSQYTAKAGCFDVNILATDEPVLMPIEFEINVKQYEYYKHKKVLWILPIGKKYLETKITTNCGTVKSEVIEVIK